MFSFLNDAHERRIGCALRAALPDVRCSCPPRCCRRSANTSAPAPPRSAPMSARCWPATSRGCRARPRSACRRCTSWAAAAACWTWRNVCACRRSRSSPARRPEWSRRHWSARQLALPNVMSFDMGGTTAKASVIADGEVAVTADYEVGGGPRQALDAWHRPPDPRAGDRPGRGERRWRLHRVDRSRRRVEGGAAQCRRRPRAGVLCRAAARVPTVTDADVVLGYLDAMHCSAARCASISPRRKRDRPRRRPLGLRVREAAARIVEVVNAQHARGAAHRLDRARPRSREFGLIAFGGAGPVHAVALAEELRIPVVIVPPAPGAFSALGLVATDLGAIGRARCMPISAAWIRRASPKCSPAWSRPGARCSGRARVPPERQRLLRQADVRYRRQAYELTVPIADGRLRRTLDEVAEAFHAKHEQTYGHANPASRCSWSICV